MHVWRQTDCLSMAHNYAEGASFFATEMHIQLSDGLSTGKALGEFPILYYVAGKLWQIGGEHYIIYRVFYLLLLLVALFVSYRTLRHLFKDAFLSAWLSLLLFTSPVFVLYGVSFLSDVPAFCFILVALSLFYQYHVRQSNNALYFSMLFFALAGLVKVSSLIVFVLLIVLLILESIGFRTLKTTSLFHKKGPVWISVIAVLACIFGWYAYASHFNDAHGFKYTFNSIYPLWLINSDEFLEVIDNMRYLTSRIFSSRFTLLLLGVAAVLNFLFWRSSTRLALISNGLLVLGSLFYFILWAPLFGVHDYYYVPFLILIPGILIPLLMALRNRYPAFIRSNYTRAVMVVFLAYNFVYCLNVVKLRTLAEKDPIGLVQDKEFVKLMCWINGSDHHYWKKFEDIRPYLLQLGIREEDRLISLPDPSDNASLYLMGHKGWTAYNLGAGPEAIQKYMNAGARYLIISKPEALDWPQVKPFLGKQIGEYEGFLIFAL